MLKWKITQVTQKQDTHQRCSIYNNSQYANISNESRIFYVSSLYEKYL